MGVIRINLHVLRVLYMYICMYSFRNGWQRVNYTESLESELVSGVFVWTKPHEWWTDPGCARRETQQSVATVVVMGRLHIVLSTGWTPPRWLAPHRAGGGGNSETAPLTNPALALTMDSPPPPIRQPCVNLMSLSRLMLPDPSPFFTSVWYFGQHN